MTRQRKIGILTLHRALNYGAVWQCWALKKACESIGCKVETIDYNPYGHYTVRGALHHKPSVAYRYLMFMRQFDRFVAKRLNPTIHTESHEWIKANPPQDDIYIVGSDQVWANVVAGDYLDSYLLDFAPANVKRISYAASTGGNPLAVNDKQHAELQKFSAISIREKQSVDDIQALVDIPVMDVCDPTLLLTKDDYAALEERPIWLPKHYVVCFNLAGDPFCEETAKEISRRLHIPVVNLAGKYKSWTRYNYMAPTPEQWLYILHHADYVCTNSFHGVCFSIIYRRPFVYCEAKVQGHNKRTGRIRNLLEQIRMEDLYMGDIEHVAEFLVGAKIEYDENLISQYRERSLEWLKNVIES